MKITEEHFQTGEVIQSTGSSLKSEECISPPLHELRCNLQVISSWCTCISHQKSSGRDKSQVCIREQGLWKCKFYFIFLFCGSTLCEPQRVLGRGQTPRAYWGTRFQISHIKGLPCSEHHVNVASTAIFVDIPLTSYLPLPLYVKHALAPQNQFGIPKMTWLIYKSFGNWEDPPPPLCCEKFPNNPVKKLPRTNRATGHF